MDTPSSAEPFGRFLTVAETAELLAVSATHVYALVRSGELAAIKIGARHWRIERVEIEAYIAAQYEESRRRAHWNESDFALLTELRGPLF